MYNANCFCLIFAREECKARTLTNASHREGEVPHSRYSIITGSDSFDVNREQHVDDRVEKEHAENLREIAFELSFRLKAKDDGFCTMRWKSKLRRFIALHGERQG